MHFSTPTTFAALIISAYSHAHDIGAPHTDEFLTLSDAAALRFQVARLDLESSAGPITRLTSRFPETVTGQSFNRATAYVGGTSSVSGKPCAVVASEGQQAAATDGSKLWEASLEVERGCEADAYLIGVYGDPGAMVFFWVRYE